MRLGAHLHVDATMSPQLADALNHDLQSFLVLYDPALRRIAVTCRDARDDAPRGSLVATGFSAGVDSFATLARYLFSPGDPALAVSALAVFDVGAFGRDGATHHARALDRRTAAPAGRSTARTARNASARCSRWRRSGGSTSSPPCST